MRLLLGGYTADMDGRATGIGVLHAGGPDEALAGGQLKLRADAARTDGSPSWVTRHPSLDVVYAALEGDQSVQAFRRTGEESFVRLGAPVHAGDAVCHVAVAPGGSSLIASCWGDGRVVRMSLDSAGVPSKPVIAPPTRDPYALGDVDPSPEVVDIDPGFIDVAAAARALRAATGSEYAHLVPEYDKEEEEIVVVAGEVSDGTRPSRAHQALFLPGSLVATTDMGLDQVRIWRIADGQLKEHQRVTLPRGSGPRHMVWHPSGHLYVVTELSREVFILAARGSGSWRIVAATTLGPTLDLDTAAELCMSRDAEFVYAGIRGSNTISTLRVRGGGAELAPIALVDSGVDWPRHHVVLRDTLLVAGQRSNEIASLSIDARFGVPGRVRHRVEAPSPTCLVPLT